MRTSFLAAIVVAIPLALLGCQRLDDEAPSPTSLGDGGGTAGDDDGGGDMTTFTPIDDGAEGTGGGPTNACDPVLQTGCAASERCTAISISGVASFICVDGGGTDLQPFDPCEPHTETGIDACPAGYACVGTGSAGLCVALCSSNGDCDAGVCGEHPETAIPHCADDCSPFDSLCAGVMQCRRGDERFSCQFPREEDVGGPLAACDAADDAGCGEGLICVSGALVPGCSNGSCCTTLCDVTDGGCTAPSTCTAVFGAPAPGFETIGACFVPS
jgi:hypothetical protein